jgi:hypothetical protein
MVDPVDATAAASTAYSSSIGGVHRILHVF